MHPHVFRTGGCGDAVPGGDASFGGERWQNSAGDFAADQQIPDAGRCRRDKRGRDLVRICLYTRMLACMYVRSCVCVCKRERERERERYSEREREREREGERYTYIDRRYTYR